MLIAASYLPGFCFIPFLMWTELICHRESTPLRHNSFLVCQPILLSRCGRLPDLPLQSHWVFSYEISGGLWINNWGAEGSWLCLSYHNCSSEIKQMVYIHYLAKWLQLVWIFVFTMKWSGGPICFTYCRALLLWSTLVKCTYEYSNSWVIN